MSDLHIARQTGAETIEGRGAGLILPEQLKACSLTPVLEDLLGLPIEDYMDLFDEHVALGGQIDHINRVVSLRHGIDSRYGPPDNVRSVVVHENAFSLISLAGELDEDQSRNVGHQNLFRIKPDGSLQEPHFVNALDKAAMRVFYHVPGWFGWKK